MQAGNITSFGSTFSILPRPRTDAHMNQNGKATQARSQPAEAMLIEVLVLETPAWQPLGVTTLNISGRI
jgi:hypothetical protein